MITARAAFFSLLTATPANGEDNPPVIAGHSVVVAQTEKDTYLLRTPSDVEYSASDPVLAESYQSLIAQKDFIISHIYATGQTVIPPNE